MRLCFNLLCCLTVAALGLLGAPPDETARVKTVVRVDARTGKLVRSVVSNAQPVAGKPAPLALDAAVRQIAAEQSLPPELLHSVIQVESNYNPGAVSPKGAQGLMQLIPETARRFGVLDSFDPVENIQGGAKYLKYLLELYQGDYPRALAAYNAGEKAVAKYGAYRRTRKRKITWRRCRSVWINAKPPAKVKPEVKTVKPPPMSRVIL